MSRRRIVSCPICDEVFLGPECLQRHRCQAQGTPAGEGWLVLQGRGETPLFDVARLERGRWLVAMGLQGLAVVDVDGSSLKRFPHHCFNLVQGPDTVLARTEKGVYRLQAGRLKRWLPGAYKLAARKTQDGFWPVVVENQLQLMDQDGRLVRRRNFSSRAWQLCLEPGRLAWLGMHEVGRWAFEILSFPDLQVECSRPLTWKTDSCPVLGPSGVVWLRGKEARYYTAGCTYIPPVFPTSEQPPRVEGHFMVLDSMHDLSSHLTVVDLSRPGRQMHVLLPDTYYRDLEGQARVQWRVLGEQLVVVDSRGRLAGIDLNSGQLLFLHYL
ncbi:MAG: hypothetical protein U0931_11970 [Vulcanimicrobiota bacterium]